MPARPSVPQVVQITMKFHWGEDLDVVNRFFQRYSTAGPLSDAGAIAVANEVGTSWAARFAAISAADYSLFEVEITDLTSPTATQETVEMSHAGTNASPSVPANTSMIVKADISRRYRGGHPRQYLGGISRDALNDPQTWLPAEVTGVATEYIAFRADIASAYPTALQPVVDVNVSYFQGFINHTFPSGRVRPIPVLRTTPLVDVISTFSVNPKVGSQRRRALQSA